MRRASQSRAAATAVAAAVANLAHLFTPEVIVVGGGVGRTGDVLLDPARAVIAEHGPAGADIDVVVAELGDDAGLVGAAAWASAQWGRSCRWVTHRASWFSSATARPSGRSRASTPADRHPPYRCR